LTPDKDGRRLLAVFAWLLAAAATRAADGELRINELQYIGSHNSYHAGMGPSEAQVWKARSAQEFAGLDYRHPRLTQQLDDGVRQIELDVFVDSQGGRYAHPAIEQLVAKVGLPADPAFADPAVMQAPGFKVMHIQDVDQRSNCQPLMACLREVRAWLVAHPQHLPVFILIETKEGAQHYEFPTVVPEPFDSSALDALDREIESVFSRREYIRPDDVRGGYATLNEAIRARGWPTLRASRGKVVFLLDQRAAGAAYLRGHPSLRGRVLFTNGTPGEADAAFVERNDGPVEEITRLVREGYLVRTRTDADLKEARANDATRRDAMLGSGAQILSTDFPRGEGAGNGYVVGFPGGVEARCDAVLFRKTTRVEAVFGLAFPAVQGGCSSISK
jgi:hypothetical protein